MWIILAIVAFIVFYIVSVYNSLKTIENRVENAWSQIDVQLQRRFDLIPNFVETVKGYIGQILKILLIKQILIINYQVL